MAESDNRNCWEMGNGADKEQVGCKRRDGRQYATEIRNVLISPGMCPLHDLPSGARQGLCRSKLKETG